jgi:hypothetical protein
MALTHTDATRNAAVSAKLGRIDAGTTNANGQLEFLAADDSLICACDCTNPAFGAPAAGVATANAIAESGNGTGTIAIHRFVNRDGDEVVRGTVTATGGGGDIELSSVTLNDEPVRITSYTYTEGA